MNSQNSGMDAALTKHGSKKIKKGSLSFSFAASLLGEKSKAGIFWLYAWCRECDDLIDDPMISNDLLRQIERISRIRHLTLQSIGSQDGLANDTPAFYGMRMLLQRYQIPSYYAEELIKGMETDISKKRYENMNELLSYCYRVAGTVGLMSCSIFGLKSISALKNAECLGIAMQLTNISRDVFDDFQMNRIYLPQEILRLEGVDVEQFSHQSQRAALVRVVREILSKADQFYKEGLEGTVYLPWRCALAVYTAGLIYREIGRVVMRRGARAWDSRAIVPKGRKFQLAFLAAFNVVLQIPRRIFNFRTNAQIDIVRINSWSTT